MTKDTKDRVTFLLRAIGIVIIAFLFAGEVEDGMGEVTNYADINTAYFAGRMDRFEWNDEVSAMWKEQGGFIAAYLQSIADDGFKNHTEKAFAY